MIVTPQTLAQYLTERGYRAQLAGTAFIKAVGAAMDSMTPEQRGQKMVDAFVAAVAEPMTTAVTMTEPSVDLGLRAAKKITD